MFRNSTNKPSQHCNTTIPTQRVWLKQMMDSECPPEVASKIVLFCFFMGLLSEASWLKWRQNQLTPMPVRQTKCDIRGRVPGEVNLSLCRQGHIPRSSNKRKEEAKASNPLQNLFMQTHNSMFSHHIPLRTVAALPGWKGLSQHCNRGQQRQQCPTAEPLLLLDTRSDAKRELKCYPRKVPILKKEIDQPA